MSREKRKTEIVTLRMPPHTKETLQAKARSAGMTLTDYLCCSGLGQRVVQVNGLDGVLSELKAQGKNLNQLTVLANTGRISFVRGDELTETYAKLQQQLAEILKEVR